MTQQMLNRFEWAKAVNKSNLLDRAKSVAWALAVNFCNQEMAGHMSLSEVERYTRAADRERMVKLLVRVA